MRAFRSKRRQRVRDIWCPSYIHNTLTAYTETGNLPVHLPVAADDVLAAQICQAIAGNLQNDTDPKPCDKNHYRSHMFQWEPHIPTGHGLATVPKLMVHIHNVDVNNVPQ
jgi:hypothetical protein